MADKTKAAVYCRSALADESKIKAQEEMLCDYAKKQQLDISGIYSDNGASGATFRRPAFNEMMNGIENGGINCVIVKGISRIGRDYLKVSNWLDDMRERNVRVISLETA